MVGVRVQFRVRGDHHLGTKMREQRAQISLQVLPGRLPVETARQLQRVVHSCRADISFTGLTRAEGPLGLCRHGRQLQAVISKLHTPLLRHAAPQRYRDTVPTTQTAFQSSGSSRVEAEAAVVISLDLPLSQRDDGYITCLAVYAEG